MGQPEPRGPLDRQEAGPAVSPVEPVDVARAYQADADMALVAEYGVHGTAVSRCLHSLGVPLRRQGLQATDITEAAQLYLEEGWSLARLGERYGCVHTAVRKALPDNGVELRPRQGWTY